ncbi:MAG: ATP-binding protein [Gammaproteobacteria bacterium]
MPYIDKILKQSPWLLEAQNIDQDIHLKRLAQFKYIHHEHDFLDHVFEDGVYIVTGPRQIGKSTHLKMWIRNHINQQNHQNFLYFNCDLLDKKQDIVELVEEYLEKFPSQAQIPDRKYIFLDEITAVKDSFLAIKYLVDTGYSENISYVLTGSNTISIRQTGEYLPGRRGKGIDFMFRPLSFRNYVELIKPEFKTEALSQPISEKDYLTIKKTLKPAVLLDDFLKTGGFPRVINAYQAEQALHEDIFLIYRSWITSEIAKADKKEFIAKAILERSLLSLGSEISYNAFAQDTGIGSHNTVYEYLDFFSNACILSSIFHFDIHQKKFNYKKNKKIYFNDPFIYAVIDAWLNAKPNQNFDYLENSNVKAQLIENLVYLFLERTQKNSIGFYKNSYEIDFVSQNMLVEVKYQNKIISEDFKNLAKIDEYPSKILITKNHFEIGKNCLLMPVEYFLLKEKPVF